MRVHDCSTNQEAWGISTLQAVINQVPGLILKSVMCNDFEPILETETYKHLC